MTSLWLVDRIQPVGHAELVVEPDPWPDPRAGIPEEVQGS